METIENSAAAVLEQGHHVVKSTLAAIIGVGNPQVVVMATEFNEWPHLAVVRPTGIESDHIVVVCLIHGHDEVEGFKVLGANLACLAADRKTSALK